MNFTVTRDGRAFVSAERYTIVRDGNTAPVYWKAYRPGPDGRSRVDIHHELCGGAGDRGWLKCVEYARTHHEANRQCKQRMQCNPPCPPNFCEGVTRHHIGALAQEHLGFTPGSTLQAPPSIDEQGSLL